jgi:thioredoxin-dependent peroxiredoxin
MSSTRKRVLEVGDDAPTFRLPSDTGETVSLGDFSGQTIILYFYPKDMTPGCTQQACDFRDAAARWKRKKAVVLGVSRDSVERHQKFRDKYDLNFPLLCDADGKVCEAYGVWQEKSLYGKKFMGIVRTTFVIDGKGKIAAIHPKVKVGGHVEGIVASL